MAKYGKITDYKKAYVTLLRKEGKVSLHQIATLCNISKSPVERISTWVWSVNCLKNGLVDLQYSTEERRIAFSERLNV